MKSAMPPILLMIVAISGLSLSFSHLAKTFSHLNKKYSVIYMKAVTQGEIFHFLVYSPNGFNGWGLVLLKPRAWNAF